MAAPPAGTVAGALIAVLDICIANDCMVWAYGFSPVSLAQLELKEKGKLILIASHVREDIELLCDEVYSMNAGVMKKEK